MPDLLEIIQYWWKKIALLSIISLLLATVVLILQPKLFLATTTALPANSLTRDQAHVFNQNIEQLYPSLGSADELDKFLGTASLQSLYNQVAEENNLAAHFGITGPQAGSKSGAVLRKRIKVQRNEWNQLQVKAWDHDPQMAAQLANAFFEKMQLLHQRLEQENNLVLLQSLRSDLEAKEKKRRQWQDSVAKTSDEQLWMQAQRTNLQNSIFETQKLVGQYELSVKNPLPSLFVLEKAWPPSKPDQPRIPGVLLLVLLVSLVFGVLVAVFVESRRK